MTTLKRASAIASSAAASCSREPNTPSEARSQTPRSSCVGFWASRKESCAEAGPEEARRNASAGASRMRPRIARSGRARAVEREQERVARDRDAAVAAHHLRRHPRRDGELLARAALELERREVARAP